MDLVAAEALRLGLWDGLAPAGLAAALSTLVFEARRPDDVVSPRLPGGQYAAGARRHGRLWREPRRRSSASTGSTSCASPTLGFAWAAYRWAEGDDLDEVLDETDLAAGDFVRWVKQLLDLSGQVADAAGDSPLRATARDVVRRIRRGVVAVAPMED